MKLVLTLTPGADAELLDAQIAFHLNAGADTVLVAEASSPDSAEAIERYVSDGHVVKAPTASGLPRRAVDELGADWVIDSRPGEFWWPRGEGLKDVLIAIPPRYTIVQALARQFISRQDGGDFFADRMTVRRPVLTNAEESGESTELRPVFRSEPGPGRDGQVPLRAWYPIEVFQFPERTKPGVGEEELSRGISAGTLVVDERLRDALRELRGGQGFRLPVDGASTLVFKSPDIVDDAAYAVECAAVGEVDLLRLDKHLRDLEARIAFLEARFWPRVLRSLSRLGGAARSRS
ncbi:MAG: hypothetical protein QOK34_414 [Gaiellaceae bacterium]|nr:hypothetical protein [Gaiellaceae bacterium]MDX6435580.1 hypothetical protein [Gaiellaceae bacterium]